MPVQTETAEASESPERRLTPALCAALRNEAADNAPEIVEHRTVDGQLRGIYVTWDEWEGIEHNTRSEIIVDAYIAEFGREQLGRCSVAMGLTQAEDARMREAEERSAARKKEAEENEESMTVAPGAHRRVVRAKNPSSEVVLTRPAMVNEPEFKMCVRWREERDQYYTIFVLSLNAFTDAGSLEEFTVGHRANNLADGYLLDGDAVSGDEAFQAELERRMTRELLEAIQRGPRDRAAIARQMIEFLTASQLESAIELAKTV